jgi:predicted nucleic acid-binding protein
MVLVDTSVWVDHLRVGDPRLQRLLEEAEVASHPFVIGELACGNIQNRGEILHLLDALPKAQSADDHEVLAFIEKHRLHGKGIGYIDACLLSSCLLSRLSLWTKDRRLANIARQLAIAHK